MLAFEPRRAAAVWVLLSLCLVALVVSGPVAGRVGAQDASTDAQLLELTKLQGNTTNVGLPCWPPETSSQLRTGPRVAVPPLVADPFAIVEPRGTVRADVYRSTATLVTPQTSDEIEAQLNGQLAEAGWTAVASGAQRQLAWSMWDVPGEVPWQGLLITVDLSGEDRHVVVLRLEPVPE